MPVYKWRRRPTKHFGEVWVPFANVELQTASGTFQEFVFQVDSGAVVSLLRRSAADVLGFPLESGRRIDLSSVGGSNTIAYLHHIEVRFPGWPSASVPFAIADSEAVPNLLGRLGVFDRLQIEFDAELTATTIAGPWRNRLTP